MAPNMTNGPRILYLSEIMPTRAEKKIPATKGGITSRSVLVSVLPSSAAIVGMNRGRAYVEMKRLLSKTFISELICVYKWGSYPM